MSGDRFAGGYPGHGNPGEWEHDPLEADERLADYVDDMLDERDRERFEAELRVSPRLREQLEQYQRTVAVVQQALRAPTQPTQLADRVMSALAREATRPSLVRRKLRPFLFAAASAAALLALALVVDRLGAPEPSQRSDFASTPPDVVEGGWEGGSGAPDGAGAPVVTVTPEATTGGAPLEELVPDRLEHAEGELSEGARVGAPAEQPNLLRLEQVRGAADEVPPAAAAKPGEHNAPEAPADADKSAKSGEQSRARGGRGAARPKSKVDPSTPLGGAVGAGGGNPGAAPTSNGAPTPGGGAAPEPRSVNPRAPGAPAGPSTGGPAGPVTGGPGASPVPGSGASGPGAPAPEPANVEGASPVPGGVRKAPDAEAGLRTDAHEGAKDSRDRAVSRRTTGLGESKEAPGQANRDHQAGDDKAVDESGSTKKPTKQPTEKSRSPAPRLAGRGERAVRLAVVTIELRGDVDAADPVRHENAADDAMRGQEKLSRQDVAGRPGRVESESVALAGLLAGFVADESVAVETATIGEQADAFLGAARSAPAPRRIGGLRLVPLAGAPASGEGGEGQGAVTRDWLVSGTRAELEQLMREVARLSAARGARLSTGEVGVIEELDAAADEAPRTAASPGAAEPLRRMVLRFRHR